MSRKPTYDELLKRVRELEHVKAKSKQTELALLDSETQLKSFLNNSPVAMGIWDSKLRYLYVNDALQKMNGPSMEDHIGHSIEEVLPKSAHIIRPLFEKIFSSGESFKNQELKGEIPSKPGQISHFLASYFPIFNSNRQVQFIGGSITDVTDLKQVQEALKLSEERFEIAMDAAQDGLYDWNLITNEIHYSPGWKEMLGYKDDELPNDFSVWEKLTETEDVNRAWAMQNDLINKKRDRFEMEFKMKHKDGHWVYILSRGKAMFNQRNEAIRIVGTHVDISERKKYENELKMKDAAIENSLNGFDIVNEEGKLIYVNKAFIKMYGYNSTEEIIKVSPKELCEDPSLPEKVIKTLKENGEYIFEHVAKRKDGSTFDILMYARLAYDEKGKEIYPTTSIDITKQKKAALDKEVLQKQLSQAQRMESVGNLAGGIAHEFNNILSIIIGNNELIMEDLPDWSLSRESSEEIRLAGLRARDVVKHLLTFSRQDDSTKKPIDTRFVVTESLKLIRATTPTNIDIQDKISPDCYPILGDSTQVNQVLINLCNNAFDALPISGGRIDVELCNSDIKQDTDLKNTTMQPGKYVRLRVRDNGSGMNKSTRNRVFEPYFTTKDIGKGSGIGLAVVHGIVENHGGSIVCESTLDEGTTFTILIPAYEGAVSEESNEKSMLSGNGERILYVDDEPSIAKLGKRHLESLGYEAHSTTDPKEALEMIKADPNRFDLVISDMAMPNMPGDQLIIEILSVNPKMPTMICSGYTSRMSETKASEMGITAFVMKPLNKTELANKVRDVLNDSNQIVK